MARRTIAFDVAERNDVGRREIERLARDIWRALSTGRDGACVRPRWINSGSVADATAYIAHRFERTVQCET